MLILLIRATSGPGMGLSIGRLTFLLRVFITALPWVHGYGAIIVHNNKWGIFE